MHSLKAYLLRIPPPKMEPLVVQIVGQSKQYTIFFPNVPEFKPRCQTVQRSKKISNLIKNHKKQKFFRYALFGYDQFIY